MKTSLVKKVLFKPLLILSFPFFFKFWTSFFHFFDFHLKKWSIAKKRRFKVMWAWLMNWAVWKLRNHIVHTERIQGINPSNRQTVSSHQDNIDSFLSGVNRSTALQKLAPKLVNQLCYFMRCSEQDHLISKYFYGGIKDKHLYGLKFFVGDNKGGFIPAKERIPYWTSRTPFWILNLTLFYIYKRWILYGINFK